MDFVFGLPRDTRGRTGILAFVHRFSKMVHLAPVAASITAQQAAALFVDVVYRHHCIPSSIVSDWDPRFTSAFWRELFKLLGTRLAMSTASHPETDGLTERANRVVEDVLRSFATSFTSWTSFLSMVEFANNNAVHSSTGLTPFFINFGRHPRVPVLLGMEHPSIAPVPASEDAAVSASSDPVTLSRAAVPLTYVASREGTHDTAAPLLHAVTTRHGAKTATQGVRTRAATRAALNPDGATQGQVPRTSAATRATPPDIAAWTSRTLIAPSQRRAVEYQNAPGAVASAVPIPANFDPFPVPQPHDAVGVNDFLAKRDSIVRFVRDTIATAVECEKEYADRRGCKNREVKLAPRFVLGDAYTLQLPTAIRLHPTFYVDRLHRYHPADVPSGAVPSQRPSPDHVHSAPVHAPPTVDSAPPDHAPVAPAAPKPGSVHAPPPLPPSGRTVRFLRDGPPPLVDSAGHVRHIVEAILEHDDRRAGPRRTLSGRGARIRGYRVPSHRQYLVRWIGPLEDSWEAGEVLLQDVPDLVAAYEASVLGGAAARRA
ncbi:hypothetical protein F444_02798 [Phytophthora nicotianae P1976]|uniref:Integrase catalytic domain-containing protein n=1 Tax=Phytophthora nicotianae P1976 TaxID=1317066 RepID=A0A081AW64_PHYNI|nr:hypothetical protein F444_02798 [Phytophthora nicotianae P1976]